MVEAGSGGRLTHRIAGLDVIRGCAVALVLVNHAAISGWSVNLGAGVVGVVMFFALSGYLITGLLMGDLARTGRVRYGRFYRNRVLRLLPPMLPVVFTYVTIELVSRVASDPNPLLSATVALTYTANLPILNEHTGGLSHFWTLATEEQFYLVWPVILAALLARFQPNRTAVAVIAGGLLTACIGLVLQVRPEHVYTLPSSWAVALLVGCGARLCEERLAVLLPGRVSGFHRAAALVSLAVIVGVSVTTDLSQHWWTYTVAGPGVAVGAVVLIFWARSSPGPSRGLFRAVAFLGTVSYSAYLWNFPVALWIRSVTGPGYLVASLATAATLLLAIASWLVIERPSARWRAHLGRSEQSDA